MRKVYLLVLLLGLLNSGYSQVAAYNFSQSAGTYTAITGGSVYGTTTSDDQRFVDPAAPEGGTTLTGVGIPIGFNFTFNGQVFDRIAINYNGWISFGMSSLTPSVDITSSSSYTSLSSTATNTPTSLRNRVAALSFDLQGRTNSELRVQTIGTAPSQTLVIQWANVKPYSSSTTYDVDTLNFQIRLSQASNQVTIQYGKCVIASTGSFTPQVGLGGSTSSDFNDRTTTTSWAASTAGTSNAATMALSATVAPASGQTYTFTQAACLPPATVSFTSTAVPNVSISWTAVSGAAGYEYRIDTTATPPASGTATTGTTGSSSTVPTGSVVYAHVRTNCGGTYSIWKNVAFVPCTNNVAPANGATNVSIPTTFDWTPVAGATNYQILVSSDNGVTYPLSAPSTTRPVTLGGLAFSTTYKFYVRAILGSDSSSTACASGATSFTTQAAPPVPVNDSICNAITLTVNGPSDCQNTTSATVSTGDPAFSQSTPNNTVWYKYTPATTGTIRARFKRPTGVTSGLLNGWLGIYTATGTCPSLTLTEVTGNSLSYDLPNNDSVTVTTTSLTAGTTYYLMIDGVSGAYGSYCIQLLPAAAPPANDSCGAPITLAAGVAVNGTTIGATQSLAPATCGIYTSAAANDVWYRITARSNGTATVALTSPSSSFDGVIIAYSGACGTLTQIGCADDNGSGTGETLNLSSLVAGQSYLIRVYGYAGGTGTYTITASGPALPVTGVNLTATRSGKSVQLGWQTLTEINNIGFEVQRSADGSGYTSFVKVASKASGGNSTAAISYSAEDEKPFTGAAYYRLKQTDKDGKVSYSNIAFVKGLAVSNLTLSAVYPNPTRDVLKAAIQSPGAEKVTFVISDMTGKAISRQVSTVNAGDNTISLNVTNLPSGNYLLKVLCSNGCETAVQKFTKQ